MMDERLSGIGEWLDASVPVPERESSEGALRQGVLAGAERVVHRRRRTRIVMMSTAATASVLLTFGATQWIGENHQAAIQFRVLPSTDPGRIGAYVAPTGDAPLDIKFTEGSVVELNPGARVRVAATTARGATVLLETGRASVDVVHRERADWTIMAGPYSVRVHGTAFTVEFDPKTQMFDLVMRSGVVTVEGPGISQPVEIRGAQRFVHRAGLGAEISEARNQQKELELTSAPAPKDPAAGTVSSGTDTGAAISNPAPASAHRAATWEGQVRRGEYSAVIREAERRGIPQVLATATAPEIMALANAARFSGRTGLGRDAYKALRQRFMGSPVAASAAFLMGRMTEGSSPQEARRWYERYEQEAPRGALVAEAMGRRLLLTQSTGSRNEVQRLAEEYVRRFPEGPYAGVARKIVAP